MAKAVRIIINEEAFVQFTPPEPFHFSAFIAQVRAEGCYSGGDVFVPLARIEMIIYRDCESPGATPVHVGGLN